MAISIPVPTDAITTASKQAASATEYQLALAQQLAAKLKTNDSAVIVAIAQVIATNFQTVTRK